MCDFCLVMTILDYKCVIGDTCVCAICPKKIQMSILWQKANTTIIWQSKGEKEMWILLQKGDTMHNRPENKKKSRPKKLMKSNNSISPKKIFLTKFLFLQFQKWPKINFWTGKKFKTAKNATWRNFLHNFHGKN